MSQGAVIPLHGWLSSGASRGKPKALKIFGKKSWNLPLSYVSNDLHPPRMAGIPKRNTRYAFSASGPPTGWFT
jgi:hypothetical protein